MRYWCAFLSFFASCDGTAASDLQVGDWRVDRATSVQAAARRGRPPCGAAEALADEELLRLEYCGRSSHASACSGSDRALALAAAVQDAAQPATPSQQAHVSAESRFLAERQPQEPGLARKLAEGRATRARLRERAEAARRRVPVRLPAGCERSGRRAAR